MRAAPTRSLGSTHCRRTGRIARPASRPRATPDCRCASSIISATGTSDRGQSWATYLADRPGTLRETIRRKLRREHRFELITGGDRLEAGIAEFETVYRRSWKEPEPFPDFNAALMRAVAPLGMLRLGVLHIGETAAAAQLWVVESDRATVLKLAHDEAFKAASPGTVLTALMLQRLIDEEHVPEIDFGRGDDGYKSAWARQRRQRIGLVLANQLHPRGMAFLGRHAMGRVRAALRRASG